MVVDGETRMMVMNINGIAKARWGLVSLACAGMTALLTLQKCQSCTDKKLAAFGAKVQCVSVSLCSHRRKVIFG
jgi:hypothetical protein